MTLHRSLESEYAKKRSDAVRLKQEWAQQVSSIRICICICMYMRLLQSEAENESEKEGGEREEVAGRG